MAGNGQEGWLARWGALAAAVVVIAPILLGAVRPASAADLQELPTVTTTLPVVSVPTVTVPPVAVTVPPVAGPDARPGVSLGGPAPSPTPSTGAVTAPAGSGGAQPAATQAVRSSSSSPPPSAGAAPVARPAAGAGPAATTTASQAGPADMTLAVRLRRAGVETARQLTFPLGLALATLAFLVLQHRVDKGDPRVATSLESGDDDLLGFS
ncbi:MAG: hypothetical protein CYG61_07125 [Actinobacteria bacterium]|nr:MAG: hypothetical protein CYG61_07125 [Actinomycetota bacterium]